MVTATVRSAFRYYKFLSCFFNVFMLLAVAGCYIWTAPYRSFKLKGIFGDVKNPSKHRKQASWTKHRVQQFLCLLQQWIYGMQSDFIPPPHPNSVCRPWQMEAFYRACSTQDCHKIWIRRLPLTVWENVHSIEIAVLHYVVWCGIVRFNVETCESEISVRM